MRVIYFNITSGVSESTAIFPPPPPTICLRSEFASVAVTDVVTGSEDGEEGKTTRWRKGNVARIVTKIDSGVTDLVGSVYHERAGIHWTDVRSA